MERQQQQTDTADALQILHHGKQYGPICDLELRVAIAHGTLMEGGQEFEEVAAAYPVRRNT